MNQHEQNPKSDMPAFEEPWQAQVYGMAQVLIENGRVTPVDWANALGAAIRKLIAAGNSDTIETYFVAVAEALETVLAIENREIDQTVEAWRSAYLATPHGKPVLISRKP